MVLPKEEMLKNHSLRRCTTRSFASSEVLPFTSFTSNINDVSILVCEGLPFKIKSYYENNQATDFVPNNIIPVRHTT